MTQTWDIGGEGGNAFSFTTIGDAVTGTILALEEVQATDLSTGELKFWSNGDKVMQYRVTLQTQLRDPQNPADDGRRDIYLKGSKKPESKSSLSAVIAAVQAATGGTTNLQAGGTLTLQYVGDGQASQRGFNPPKQYAAAYQAPAVNLVGQAAGNAWDGQQPAAAPVQQQAPVVPQAVTQPAMVAPPVVQQPAPQQAVQPAPAAPPAVDQQATLASLAALNITPEQLLAAQQAAAAQATQPAPAG